MQLLGGAGGRKRGRQETEDATTEELQGDIQKELLLLGNNATEAMRAFSTAMTGFNGTARGYLGGADKNPFSAAIHGLDAESLAELLKAFQRAGTNKDARYLNVSRALWAGVFKTVGKVEGVLEGSRRLLLACTKYVINKQFGENARVRWESLTDSMTEEMARRVATAPAPAADAAMVG